MLPELVARSFDVFALCFLASDFTLKPSDCPDTEFPVRIADSDRGCLWYKKDNKFKIPKGEACPPLPSTCEARLCHHGGAFSFSRCSLRQIPHHLSCNPAVCQEVSSAAAVNGFSLSSASAPPLLTSPSLCCSCLQRSPV